MKGIEHGDEGIERTDPKRRAGREHADFRREGEFWTIVYAGTTCRLRDTAGLRHLAHLLARPEHKVPATEMLHMARNGSPTVPRAAGDRLRDRSSIISNTPAGERARVAVTRSIRAALQRIAVHNPQLAEHFRATIRTGACCAYKPDPRLPLRWEL